MSKVRSDVSAPGPWTLTTRRIATAGILAAIVIVLGVGPGFGFVPLPLINATTEHIPVILGSILEGPLVGMVTGLIFGLVSYFRALTLPLNPIVPFVGLSFRNPLVAVIPRILIGLTTWLVFAGLRRVNFGPLQRLNLDISAFVAGLVGAITNTVFVSAFAVGLGYWPPAFVPFVIPQAITEAIVAAILAVLIARAMYIVRGGSVRATETKSREELPY